MKTFSLAAAGMLIAVAATATHAKPANAAVTVVASASPSGDAGLGPTAPAHAAPVASDKTAAEGKPAQSTPTQAEAPKAVDDKAKIDTPPAPVNKPALHAAKFANGDGSVWKASRGYAFTGSYRGCHYQGYVNGSGYHVDKSC